MVLALWVAGHSEGGVREDDADNGPGLSQSHEPQADQYRDLY
jgi:hypothetical protein